jgi:hypothetical protein
LELAHTIKMDLILPADEIKKKLNEVIGKFAFLLHREIINRVPSRFRNRIVVNERNGEWSIGTNEKIFIYWEKGTKSHDIYPKFAKSLRFEWENHPVDFPPAPDGFHYLKKVRHPGTKGKEIIKEISENKALLNKLLRQAIN